MDADTRKRLAQIIGAFVTAFLIWLLGWLCGCSLSVKDGDFELRMLYPDARAHWNVTIDPYPDPTTQPAPSRKP